MLNSHN